MAKQKKTKKTSIWWYILPVLLILSLLGVALYQSKSKPKGKESDYSKVTRRSITEKVGASGRIFPETEVKISSDVSGEIVSLHVEEGDSVAVGQLLAKIDPDAYQSAVERGVAGLNATKSEWSRSKSQIENNRAQIEQITVQIKNAEKIWNRNRDLFNQGVISKADLEMSESNLDQLKANKRAADAGIKASEQSAKAAEYSIKSSEASLKELKTNLRKTSIYAPTDGIVSSLSVEQGERVVGTIQMTGTEMMRIANLSEMEAQVEVSENDILRVKKGDGADIEVDAYLGRTFKGTVTEIGKSASNAVSGGSLTSDQVTNFIVKLRLDPASYSDLVVAGKDYPFRPGMSATVDINTSTSDSVLCVPIQAVTMRDINIDDEDKKEDLKEVVFTVKNDSAQMVIVTTGVQDDEYIEIKSGLDLDQKIIKGPYSLISRKLEDGDAVTKKKKSKKKSKDKD